MELQVSIFAVEKEPCTRKRATKPGIGSCCLPIHSCLNSTSCCSRIVSRRVRQRFKCLTQNVRCFSLFDHVAPRPPRHSHHILLSSRTPEVCDQSSHRCELERIKRGRVCHGKHATSHIISDVIQCAEYPDAEA